MDMQKKQHMLFQGLCRTCLHEVAESMAIAAVNAIVAQEPQREWHWIFDTAPEFDALKIAKLLSTTMPKLIVQTDDELPQKICRECLEQLVNVYKFQQMCFESERKMRKLLRHNKIKNDMLDAKQARNRNETNLLALSSPTVRPSSGYVKSSNDPLEINDDADIKIEQITTSPPKAELNENDSVEENSEDAIPQYALIGIEINTPLKVETLSKQPKNRTTTEDSSSESDWEDLPLQTLREKTQKKTPLNAKRKEKVEQSVDSCTDVEAKSTHSSRTKKQYKQYVCEYCNKNFKQSSTLKNHLRIHTGEQPYLCSECGKAFHTSSNLKTHLIWHSNAKPFECPECPKRFSTKSGMTSHQLIHRTEKPHICDQCGTAFSQPYELKRHKFYHTGEKPHKCEYCEKRFARSVNKRRHMLTHTGEKPYKCKYCERAFSQSNELIQHLRSHLGENVYRCELCPSAFRKAVELRKHYTSHKNENEETREKNLKALIENEQKHNQTSLT